MPCLDYVCVDESMSDDDVKKLRDERRQKMDDAFSLYDATENAYEKGMALDTYQMIAQVYRYYRREYATRTNTPLELYDDDEA